MKSHREESDAGKCWRADRVENKLISESCRGRRCPGVSWKSGLKKREENGKKRELNSI
ncbi:hypothetical protein HMPREF1508_1707 [Shuttleworthella sp. MSX8B]|nr:hypothetical protein HMPREF1508_1707 [Shuttleworthia sp. MSX8B]